MNARGSMWNVKDLGATGDGITLDTAAINHAIESCAEAGGGTVQFPAGVYLSGTIHLKSHVTLLFEAGAELLGSSVLDHYVSQQAGGGVEGGARWHRGLLLGEDVEDITLLGPGSINGNNVYDIEGEENMRGPHAVLLHHCKQVSVRNLAVKDAANYALLITECQGLDVNGVKVTGGWDGINFWNCRDVVIFGCSFQTGDDSLAGGYWDNVTIDNCLLNSSCNGIRLVGPAERVAVSNCLIRGPGAYPHRTARRTNSLAGVQICPGTWFDTPGLVDDVHISNTVITGVRTPFWIGMWGPGIRLGRISISNVTATGAGRVASLIEGTPDHPIESVTLRNVTIETQGGGTQQDAAQSFPALMMDKDPWNVHPVAGLYCHYVKDLSLQDVRLAHRAAEARPALVCHDVERLELDDVTLPDAHASLVLQNVRQVQSPKTGLPVMQVEPRQAGIKGGFAQGVIYSHLSIEPYSQEQYQGATIFGTAAHPSFEPYLYEHFTARAIVHNLAATAAEEKVSLYVDGQAIATQTLTLGPGEGRNVVFSQPAPAPGRHTLGIGPLAAQEVSVLGPVVAPYQTFANVDAAFRCGEGRCYVRAAGRNRMDFNDDYGTIYQKGALPEAGTVIVKLEQVDPGSGLRRARLGLMVRNDITQPGAATGYVIMAASICNGWAMEWDADGDGKLEGHTEFAGYSQWPSWLKLEKHGVTFNGSYSLDGTTWIQVGSVTLPSAAPVQDVGVFTSRGMACFADWGIQKRD
jgi:hypothetical protein